MKMEFPVLLDMEVPEVYAYSIYSVIAEKFEACPLWIQLIPIIPLSRHGVKKQKAGYKHIKVVIRGCAVGFYIF